VIVYIGQCDQIKMANGDIIEINPPVPLGICAQRGLVTAATRQDLAAGRLLNPPPGAAFERITSVDYIRNRPQPDGSAQRLWMHDVTNTECALSTFGPVFRHVGAPAYVCPSPPGDFICGG